MNKRSQATLRDFSHELTAPVHPDAPDSDEYPDPYRMARLMVDHNNERNGARLDWTIETRQAPDLTWYVVGYVFDTTGMPADGGGDVHMCWWQRTVCPECQGYGYTEVSHPSTDALIGSRTCTQKHRPLPPPPPSAPRKHLEGCNGADKIIPICCSPF